MRSLLFVSPHFPPDSAAGTHRARLLAPHLADQGWRPTVLTVDSASIEGELDDELADAGDSTIHVERVHAWPHTTTRRVGFGDLGLRAYVALRRRAFELGKRQPFNAALVTTYPTYPALIGAELKKQSGVPFVLDLQDPWVGAWGKTVGPGGKPDLRSRVTRALATRLETRAARAADALMSVTDRTLQELVDRVPAAAQTPRLEVPIGWEPSDWMRVREENRQNGYFDPHDGAVHICAVGTVLPTALCGVRAFLAAVRDAARQWGPRRRVNIWFLGTSNQRCNAAPAIVAPLAADCGVDDIVHERPGRTTYFDALRVLRDAHAVLVIGSSEPHYTPSRVFPALASRRPIIARLHAASPAHRLLQSAAASRPVHLIDWSTDLEAERAAFADALASLASAPRAADAPDDSAIEPFTGRALARRVATLLDEVTVR